MHEPDGIHPVQNQTPCRGVRPLLPTSRHAVADQNREA